MALVLLGCGRQYALPALGLVDFAVADPELAVTVRDAGEDWARAGVELAAFVSVNQESDAAVLVVRVARSALPWHCYYTAERAREADAGSFDACTMYYAHDGRRRGIFIADDISAERLGAVVRHEMIHVLLPLVPHIEAEVAAVFHADGTSLGVTAADVEHLSGFTAVTRAEVAAR